MTALINRFADISGRYDTAFVDLWGCVHDGIAVFPGAVSALSDFRRSGGTVVLVTNAPREWGIIATQLDQIGVPRDCWDAIATSGDSARAAMFEGLVGTKVWFMGDSRDRSFFQPPKVLDDPLPIEPVPLDDADGIVCCGPFDALADPSVNRPEFLAAKTRGLKLLCANPDIVVDRGGVREWCAGALAALYTEMGGESLYFGKPHPPIYDLARRRLAALGKDAPNDAIVAIGDGIRTDIIGALGEDIDSLFITGGLAAEETQTGGPSDGQPDKAALRSYLATEAIHPTFAIGHLR